MANGTTAAAAELGRVGHKRQRHRGGVCDVGLRPGDRWKGTHEADERHSKDCGKSHQSDEPVLDREADWTTVEDRITTRDRSVRA